MNKKVINLQGKTNCLVKVALVEAARGRFQQNNL